jgi:hypothetical protein
MAQPPAVIVKTFKPVGQLQLYRLGERANFYCIRCRKNKMARDVATMGGDWAKMVCSGCYGVLVHAEWEKRKKAPKAEHRPVQVKQSSRKVDPKDHGEPSLLTAGEEQQLQRQLPGVDRLIAFFHAAGVPMGVGSDGHLWINRRQTRPLAWVRPSPKPLNWNTVIDELVPQILRDDFIRAVKDNARFGEGLHGFLRERGRERGYVIMRDSIPLAVIHPTHAEIPRREVIYANFLIPGPHWQQVADVLHGAEPELVVRWKREQEAKAATEAAAAEAKLTRRAQAKAKRRRPADAKAKQTDAAQPRRTDQLPGYPARRANEAVPRRIDQLPDDLAPELINACLDASRRIRLERQMYYDRPVFLRFDVGELTLLPIAGTETRLRMPFRLSKGTETLQGELLLRDRDPLPLVIGGNVADEDVKTAWTCALLGFAAVTCVELEPTEATARREPPTPRFPTASISHHRSSIQAVPRNRSWPRHLEPVGDFVHYSGSFVPGHRRRLPDDWTASDEKRDWARQVGIILGPHETWVRPHARGMPKGIEIRFLWHAPPELKLIYR